IASQHKGIAHTNLPIFNYRQTRFTITSTGNSNLKMKAILIEKNWYDSFLKIVPSDPNDRIIYGSLVKLLDGYIRNKKLRTLSDSLDSNFFGNLSNWNKSKSLYHITLTDIAKAAFNSLKKRI
ncbi:MAG: hypothetical protein ACXVAU_17080, partial [Mucilaginibacter sp.]